MPEKNTLEKRIAALEEKIQALLSNRSALVKDIVLNRKEKRLEITFSFPMRVSEQAADLHE